MDAIISSMHALCEAHTRGPPLSAADIRVRLQELTARAAILEADGVSAAAVEKAAAALKVGELRSALAHCDEPVGGKKAELVKRLLGLGERRAYAAILAYAENTLDIEHAEADPPRAAAGPSAQKASSMHEPPLSKAFTQTLHELTRKHAGQGPQHGIFTDGSCHPNPGPGGWGAVAVSNGAVQWSLRGADKKTTNNRMELVAIIEALRRLPEGGVAVIYSDSNLCVRTLNEWAASWEKRGWKRPDGGDVMNLDLVQEAVQLKRARPNVSIQWLRGHAGSTWNEYADRLADEARISKRVK